MFTLRICAAPIAEHKAASGAECGVVQWVPYNSTMEEVQPDARCVNMFLVLSIGFPALILYISLNHYCISLNHVINS